MRLSTVRRPLIAAIGASFIAGLAVVGGTVLDNKDNALPVIAELDIAGDQFSSPCPSFRPRSDSQLEEENFKPVKTVLSVNKGDTLMDIMLRAGVNHGEAVQAIGALREVYNPRALRAGQSVTVTFSPPEDGIGSGSFDAISLEPAAGRQVTAKRAEDGYSAQEIKHQEYLQVVRANGQIRGSLFESARKSGIPTQVVVDMIRAFSYDVDFQRDIQAEDGFEIMFNQYVDSKGNLIRNGDIAYANLILSGKSLQIYRYEDMAGNVDFYNPKGESVRKAMLRTPVDGARISSSFGMRRHPVLGYSKLHKGVDFAVAIGTPVMAAGDGVIEKAGPFGTYGYYVRIRHDGKHQTAYAHLSRFAQGIRAGTRVRQGQIVAYSGNTGRSTGPHLHYEMLVNNATVNPLSVKFQSGAKLTGKELARFQDAIKKTGQIYAKVDGAETVALATKK